MSLVASGQGMDGAGGGDDKKRKKEPIDKPVLTSTSEDDSTDTEESTTTDRRKKKRGLSKHYVGKSKSYGKLTNLGNKNSSEIVKKEHKVNKRRREEIAKKFRKKSRYGASVCSKSVDQPMADAVEEGEIVSNDDDKKEKKNKEKKHRKKSKSRASGSHSPDQPMTEAAEDDKKDDMADD